MEDHKLVLITEKKRGDKYTKSEPSFITQIPQDTTKQMKAKTDLELILYKLKSFYDTISIMQQQKSKRMEDLQLQHDQAIRELKERKDHANIDSEKMKLPFIVSILNSKNVKETKEEIQKT